MALAFLAGLLPGIGIFVLGLVLMSVVGQRIQEEIARETRREGEALARRTADELERLEALLERHLTRPPRLPQAEGPAHFFDLVRHERGPWGLPAPPPTFPLRERLGAEDGLDLTAFLPGVEELEFRLADATTAADRYRDLARFSPDESADAARFLMAQAGALERAGRWEETLAVWTDLSQDFRPDASVDGLPLDLTAALQQVAVRDRLARSEEARALAHELLVALDQDQVPLPPGESAAALADARRQLGPFLDDAPPFQGSLRPEELRLRSELEALAAALPDPPTAQRAVRGMLDQPAVLLLRSEPRAGRVSGAWLPVASLPDALAPPPDGMPVAYLLSDPDRDEDDGTTLGVPGLPALRVQVTASPELARQRLAPWRMAVGTGVGMVALMSLASAFLASLAVRRRLRFARLQGELVASISHELRTPLTAMLLNLELLEDPRLEEEGRQDHTRRVRASAERLQRLVERVLAFARTGRGQAHREPAPVPVAELFDAACDEVGAVLPPASVRREVAPGLPPVLVDRDDLVQVLVALLDNAARHAPGAAPTLRAAMDGEGTVRVEVADEGPGIPPDQRTEMFEPFHQGSRGSRPPARRARQGLGLGLAIARGLIEAAGGRIHARPTHPGGSPEGLTMVLHLPVAPDPGGEA